jgi:hypothetical protein
MTGGVWVASFVVLWAAVGVLLLMVLALVRQVGVLHARLDEVSDRVDERLALDGGLDGSGAGAGAEGPLLGEPAPLPGRIAYGRAPMTLVAFTSPTCELSQALAPALRAIDRQYAELRVLDLPLGPRTMSAFEAFKVSATPFVVAVDREGCVRGRGRARNLAQLDELVVRAAGDARAAAAERRAGAPGGRVPGPVNGTKAHAHAHAGAGGPESSGASTISAPPVAPDATHGTENGGAPAGEPAAPAGEVVPAAVEPEAPSEAASPTTLADEVASSADVPTPSAVTEARPVDAVDAVVADLSDDPQLVPEADPARVDA